MKSATGGPSVVGWALVASWTLSTGDIGDSCSAGGVTSLTGLAGASELATVASVWANSLAEDATVVCGPSSGCGSSLEVVVIVSLETLSPVAPGVLESISIAGELLGGLDVVVGAGLLASSAGAVELDPSSTAGWLVEVWSSRFEAVVDASEEDSSNRETGTGELWSDGAGLVSREVMTVFASASACSVEPLTTGPSLPAAALSIATGPRAGVVRDVGVVSWEVINVFAPASGCNVEPLTAGSSLPAAALSIATGGLVEAVS